MTERGRGKEREKPLKKQDLPSNLTAYNNYNSVAAWESFKQAKQLPKKKKQETRKNLKFQSKMYFM